MHQVEEALQALEGENTDTNAVKFEYPPSANNVDEPDQMKSENDEEDYAPGDAVDDVGETGDMKVEETQDEASATVGDAQCELNLEAAAHSATVKEEEVVQPAIAEDVDSSEEEAAVGEEHIAPPQHFEEQHIRSAPRFKPPSRVPTQPSEPPPAHLPRVPTQPSEPPPVHRVRAIGARVVPEKVARPRLDFARSHSPTPPWRKAYKT